VRARTPRGPVAREDHRPRRTRNPRAGPAFAVYRAGAWNAKGQLIGDSASHSGTRKATVILDGFTVTPAPGGVHASWIPYAGSSTCFTTCRVSWSATSADVSYLGAHDLSADNSTQAGADANETLAAGTYYVRAEVIRTTELESFAVAASAVRTVAVSP